MNTAAVGIERHLSIRQAQLLLFYSYFAFGTLLQVFPPLLGDLQREFHTDHFTGSLVMSFFLGPMVLVAVPAGMLGDRVGVTAVGRSGLLLMIAGAVLNLASPSWAGVLAGRALAGIGGGLLLVSVIKIGVESVPRPKLGISMGLFAAGLPVGTGLSFNLLRPAAGIGGWRASLLAATLLVVSALAVFELLGAHRTSSEKSLVNPMRALRSAELWRLSGVTATGYAAILGFSTWAPTTLVPYAGIPLWAAALVASVLLVIDIPFAPLWGFVSDRVGRRRPFVLIAFGIYLLGSLAVPLVAQTHQVVPLTALIAGMGIGCAMFFPAALSIPAETVAHDRVGAAYGLFFTAQVAGMLAGPMVIGRILDIATPTLAFLGVSAITALGLAVAFSMRSR